MSAGYEFVPLPDRVSVRQRPEAVHDRRVEGTLSGALSLTFATEQLVHVGSGFKALVEGKVVRQGVLVRGRPGVPGSSMKGVLRARYEALTRSCAPRPPRVLDVRSQSRPSIKRARLAQKALNKPAFHADEGHEDGLCPACALFGRMSRRSRVTLTDFSVEGHDEAFVTAPMPEQFGPNLHHVGPATVEVDPRSGGDGGSREIFEVHDLHGRKFAVGRGPLPERHGVQSVECIRRGASLRGQMRLVNVLPAELGGLLVALGWRPQSALKIGAGKAHGFGRMHLAHVEYRLRGLTDDAARKSEEGWRADFEGWEDRFAEGMQRLVAMHQGDC
ncbi:RAMP superfamily CRISPR-associated protein [Sorangium sp. So ce388]|uniref:RAMP superfamily CRISPR-associated protein n=1 Tax=Sorangium sp. So ce388 TaxID=3133309 RepID=UPI003F5BC6CC